MKRAAEEQPEDQQAQARGPRPHTATVESGKLRAVVSAMDGGSLPGGITTGICFLNHMIDQLTAHGQLAIAAQVSLDGVPFEHTADYTGSADPDPAAAPRPHDEEIFRIVGVALGECLGAVIGSASAGMVRFCSPLDEAFSEVEITFGAPSELDFKLAPFGIYPTALSDGAVSQAGREWIGKYRCALTESLWQGVTSGLDCRVQLRKVRGDNAHHIIEASFKSLGRALRAAIDRKLPEDLQPVNPLRSANRKRETKETSINVQVEIGGEPKQRIKTGVETLDRMLQAFGEKAHLGLVVECVGDLYICEHHTVEDVALAVGQSLCEALADRRGCVRMAVAQHSHEDAAVEVVMDLSNRPGCFSDIKLDQEMVGDMSAEMVVHFFESIASSTRVLALDGLGLMAASTG